MTDRKYTICVVTGTRAEYGLLKPVIEKIQKDEEMTLYLLVTGTHLCKEFGYTVDEIKGDGYKPDCEVPCISQKDRNSGMVQSLAEAMKQFDLYFKKNKMDMVVLLGDRYEIFGCAVAAAMNKMPIAHLYGGDSTEGAVDEFLRHAITKMSYLHFVSNEQSQKRVIQLGENPERVFLVGATGAENIVNMKLLEKTQLEESISFNLNKPYAIVTFHPVTMDEDKKGEQFQELLNAVDSFPELNFIFTKANADDGGRVINSMIDDFVKARDNCVAFESLGVVRYLSAVKYAAMVIGNSSSGIYEAPLFGIPTINIGDRQKGRLQSQSVFNCEPEEEAIICKINEVQGLVFDINSVQKNSPYFKMNTSDNIVKIIKETLKSDKINLKKKFYDLEVRDEM